MLNELLEKQVQKYLGIADAENVELRNFLEAISNTYNKFKDVSSANDNQELDYARAIRELNVRLRNEAEELKRAHLELGKILSSVNYGFFSRNLITDSYTYLSEGCERIYGYPIEEFFENARLWYQVIHPDDRIVVKRDNERLKNKEHVYTQYRIIHKDQSIKWIESTLIPFFKDDLLVRVDGVVNDITKRKEEETERDIMMQELITINGDLKQFSYITSHNLRSPLSNIEGIIGLFDFDQNDVHNRRLVEMLKTTTEQLHTTIEDLTQILIIKNNAHPDATYLNVEDTFNNVAETFTNAINEVGGKVFTNFKSSPVKLKKVFLESVFTNLISNAVKYHSNERSLIIRVESSDEDDHYVNMKFSDNGIGIDLDRHKGKIFGLYQRFHDNVEGK
ncbi:MAG: sensor histidine kinase, partial [Segetibacter sp.]